MPKCNWSVEVNASEQDIQNLMRAYHYITGFEVTREGNLIKGSTNDYDHLTLIQGVKRSPGQMTYDELQQEVESIKQQMEGLTPGDVGEYVELEHDLWVIERKLSEMANSASVTHTIDNPLMW